MAKTYIANPKGKPVFAGRLHACCHVIFQLKKKIKMKRKLLIIGSLIALSPILYSFCGFYVSKADGTLKNKTSQVILVRDGNKTVITMYNDYKGELKDFAMVNVVLVHALCGECSYY